MHNNCRQLNELLFHEMLIANILFLRISFSRMEAIQTLCTTKKRRDPPFKLNQLISVCKLVVSLFHIELSLAFTAWNTDNILLVMY